MIDAESTHAMVMDALKAVLRDVEDYYANREHGRLCVISEDTHHRVSAALRLLDEDGTDGKVKPQD